MKKEDKKKILLQKGAELIHKNGYNNTGLNEILTACELPKGSFYFYFKSKEDFGMQLIDYYLENFFNIIADENYSNPEPSYLVRLEKFFTQFMNISEQINYLGCPIGNCTLELSVINDNFRNKLQESLEKMKQKILKFLNGAQQNGEIPGSMDIFEISDYILNSWEGALLRMKATKSTEPLKLFHKILFNILLKTENIAERELL